MLKENLKNYLVYLQFIQNKLDKYFEAQSPFIFCQKGCGMCCKNQQFPYSQVEAEYLLLGLSKLPPDVFKIVEKNINKLIDEKKNTDSKNFRYDCPFLVNDVCSNYEYRGLICRAFGLMVNPEDSEEMGIPFCSRKGLNYSNVMNFKTHQISKAKLKKLKTDKIPSSYCVTYEFLTNDDFAKGFDFEFGKKKSMADWLELFKKEADLQ